jgi:hypothetical protein
MKLSDIPPHVTDINPPWFSHKFSAKYGEFPDYFCDMEPQFHLNYYDGPLSGIFKCKGHFYYGKAIYEEDRKFWAAWELSEQELSNILERHKLFQEYVGMHTDYTQDENGDWHRDLGKTKPREGQERFYKNDSLPKIDLDAIHAREIFGILWNPFANW